jgi:hypothetical protein
MHGEKIKIRLNIYYLTIIYCILIMQIFLAGRFQHSKIFVTQWQSISLSTLKMSLNGLKHVELIVKDLYIKN